MKSEEFDRSSESPDVETFAARRVGVVKKAHRRRNNSDSASDQPLNLNPGMTTHIIQYPVRRKHYFDVFKMSKKG